MTWTAHGSSNFPGINSLAPEGKCEREEDSGGNRGPQKTECRRQGEDIAQVCAEEVRNDTEASGKEVRAFAVIKYPDKSHLKEKWFSTVLVQSMRVSPG